MIRFALVLFALLAFDTSANAAGSVLSVTEYARAAPQDNALIQVAVEPAITDQTPVDFSGGAAASAAFSVTTNLVRISCSVRCAVRFSTAGTAATTSNRPMAADTPEYFGVSPGYKVSVIASP